MKFKNLFFAMMTLVFSVVISKTQDNYELCQSLLQDNQTLSMDANHPIVLQPGVGENLRIINANLQIDQEIPDSATIEFLHILNQPNQLIILRSLENQHTWQTTNYFFEDVQTIWQIDEDYTPAGFRYVADDTVWIDSIIGVSREYYFLDLQSGLMPFDYIQFWDEEKYQFGRAQPTYSPDFTRVVYWPNRQREEFNIQTIGTDEELVVQTVSQTGEFFTWSTTGDLIIVNSSQSLERDTDFVLWNEYHIYNTHTGALVQEILPPEQLFNAHVAYDRSRSLSAKLVWDWDDNFLAFFWQSQLGEFLYIYDLNNAAWLNSCFEVTGEDLPNSVLTDFYQWTPDNRYIWWSRLSDGQSSSEEAFNHVDVFAVDRETLTFHVVAQNVGWLTSIGYIE